MKIITRNLSDDDGCVLFTVEGVSRNEGGYCFGGYYTIAFFEKYDDAVGFSTEILEDYDRFENAVVTEGRHEITIFGWSDSTSKRKISTMTAEFDIEDFK